MSTTTQTPTLALAAKIETLKKRGSQGGHLIVDIEHWSKAKERELEGQDRGRESTVFVRKDSAMMNEAKQYIPRMVDEVFKGHRMDEIMREDISSQTFSPEDLSGDDILIIYSGT